MSTMARNSGHRSGKAKKPAGSRDKTTSGLVACPSCDGKVQAHARYCQHCGKSLSGEGWFTSQSITVLAAAVIVLVALGLLFSSVIDFDRAPASSAQAPATTGPTTAGQPPDLSTMSPREAADRLFNRVMMADEQGNQAEIEQFTPMAVAAYERLENLDTDALFHVGMIHIAAGDLEQAKGFAERIMAIAPTHLFVPLLEHRVAEEEGNTSAAVSAASKFHQHYEEEMSIGRSEYEHHRASIERFRANVPDDNANGG